MKKTEFITFRTNEATKQALEKYAAEKKWTISFVVEQIVQEWVENSPLPSNPHPEIHNSERIYPFPTSM